MSPFAGTRIIPSRWAEHHRPVVAGTQTAAAVFKRISDGPAPWPTPEDWPGATTIWETTVRVQELNRETGPIPANQPTKLREYMVSAPLDGPELRAGEQGDVVYVIGRQLRISSIMFGSLEFERDLICVDNLTQQNPA